jgi:leucyl-tRNA synthetase
MDHDRASGEGVMPQEYVLVKQQLLEPFPAALSALNGTTKKVYLVPATLRPETMYGQTNVWVLPDGEYGAFEINDNEIFICTERSAINLSYQGFSHEFGKIKCLASFTGKDLMGAAVKAPLTKYDKIYVWPMFSVSTEKTTGVVTSVPSDSPDDFVAWRDVQQKQQLRDTFKLSAEQVTPFEVVPIINIPDLGDKAAENVVTRMKINGQGDRVKLDEAKEIVYKAGFYEGTLTVGPYAGEKVEKAKEKIRSELLASGQAIIYSEPEAAVVSRSGDNCVVALVDQWYLPYGEDEWRTVAEKCLSQMTTYDPETRAKMEAAFKWMHQWACSRTYGLGTKLPWDPSYLIESLSDSTIYMAYYTIAHLLQGGVMDGSKAGPAAIKPEQLTYEFFEHIFCDGPAPAVGVPAETLAKLKKEFAYWYPVDLRASGKDLIPNHLIFWVYNHVAIFPEKYWPKSVRTNGHLLRDKEKMSKSKGNFLILHDAVEMFSADGMRFALADAGDSLEDANFSEDTVNNAVLKLFAQYHWIVDTLKENAKLRAGAPSTFADKVFESKINKAIELTDKAYAEMVFHEAVKTGFYDLQAARDNYVTVCQAEGQEFNKELIERFIRVQVIMISPVTPHWSEHIWRNVLHEQGSVTKASWPTVGPIDNDLLKRNDYLMHTLHNFRLKLAAHMNPKKGAKPPAPTTASIYIADRYPEWQEKTLVLIRKLYNEQTKEFPANKEINDAVQADATLKAQAKKIMPFFNFIKEEVKSRGVEAMELTTTFSEKDVLQNNISYVCK